MADKEEKILDDADFLRLAEVIRKQVLANTKLAGASKRIALTVLDGVVKSVKVHGARQHGINKKMLATALQIFGKMSEDKRHNEDELMVLRALTVIIAESMHAK